MRAENSELRVLLPFYAGLFVMAAAAIAALGFAIDTPEFALRAYVLVGLGLGASLLGAVTGRNPSFIGAIIAAVVYPLLVLANTGAELTRWFYPDETLGDHSLLLPTMAVWCIVAVSFAQASRPNAIFVFIGGLVVFSLTGTLNLNESLLISFFVFLLATYFVWSYNGALNLREEAQNAGQVVADQPARWAHTQMGVAVALLCVVFVAAVLGGYPAYSGTRNLFVAPWSQNQQRSTNPPITQNWSGFSDQFVLNGGSVTLSDGLALTVRATAPALWRGLVYDQYTQRGWRRTMTASDFRLPESPPGSGRYVLWEGNWNAPQGSRLRWIHQEIETHAPTGDSLIAAATATTAQGIERSLRASVDGYGCLHAPPRFMGPRRYMVSSVAPAPTAQELDAAPTEYPDLIEQYYLPVPPGTRAELQDLADQITAGARTPFRKAQAIEKHLYEQCRYTLDVPPIPSRQDSVAYFLKTTRRGACDLFSSSLVVLLRLSGVPARVVTGYQTGELSADTGAYEVTNADAHAWAEVYYPGIGWVEHDPVVQREPDRLSWLRKLFEPGWTRPALGVLGKRAVILVIVAVLLNAFILAVVGASPAQLTAGWLRRRRSAANPRQQVALSYLEVCGRVGRRTRPRGGWQTPTDYAREVAGSPALPEELREVELPALTSEFLRLRYGPAAPSSDEARTFARQAADLARRIRRAPRTKRPS